MQRKAALQQSRPLAALEPKKPGHLDILHLSFPFFILLSLSQTFSPTQTIQYQAKIIPPCPVPPHTFVIFISPTLPSLPSPILKQWHLSDTQNLGFSPKLLISALYGQDVLADHGVKQRRARSNGCVWIVKRRGNLRTKISELFLLPPSELLRYFRWSWNVRYISAENDTATIKRPTPQHFSRIQTPRDRLASRHRRRPSNSDRTLRGTSRYLTRLTLISSSITLAILYCILSGWSFTESSKSQQTHH